MKYGRGRGSNLRTDEVRGRSAEVRGDHWAETKDVSRTLEEGASRIVISLSSESRQGVAGTWTSEGSSWGPPWNGVIVHHGDVGLLT